MKRPALVALLAVSATIAVMLWPASPRWRFSVEPGQALGFADASTVVRSIGGETITLVRHDATTGAERSRVTLADLPPELRSDGVVTLSPDGRRALVYRLNDNVVGWALYDADRGTRLTPFVAMPDANIVPTFSADGRWFDVPVWNRVGSRMAWTPAPRDAATGAPLPGFAAPPNEVAHTLAFRDDGERAAVVWGPPPDGKTPPTCRVEIVALPTGEAVKRFPLPAGNWDWAVEYRGDRLTLLNVTTNTTGDRHHRGVAFAVAADPVGLGVDAPEWAALNWGWDEWQPGPAGPGWATRTRWRARTDAFPYALAVVAVVRGWIGPMEFPGGTVQRLRFVDPATGAVRSELPAWIDSEAVVSPDGRWVVALSEGRLDGWSAEPPWPRGPLAMVAAGAVLLLGRRRRR